jgi:hypothetical protein
MAAPLIARSPEDLRADRQEVVLFLHDFSFRAPEELLAGRKPSNSNGMLKRGTVVREALGILRSAGGPHT